MKSEKVYIEYLNKEIGFRESRKYFESYDLAIIWGQKNLSNFNLDQIKFNF